MWFVHPAGQRIQTGSDLAGTIPQPSKTRSGRIIRRLLIQITGGMVVRGDMTILDDQLLRARGARHRGQRTPTLTARPGSAGVSPAIFLVRIYAFSYSVFPGLTPQSAA